MEKKVFFRDQPLYYRDLGQGDLVVLLHGFGESGSLWNGQLDWMQQACRVLVPDLPGSGASGLHANLTIESVAGAVATMIAAEAGGKLVTVIGHSMGGYVALALAEQNPDQLSKLGLFHSTAYADTPARVEVRKKAIDFIRNHGAHAFLESFVPNLFSAATKQRNPGLVASFFEEVKGCDAATLIASHQAMMQRPDRAAVLSAFEGPVLFMIGKNDALIPYTDVLKQTYLPCISHIHLLQECGHMAMLEDPGQTRRALEDFLSAK